jgi:hypothetical protein
MTPHPNRSRRRTPDQERVREIVRLGSPTRRAVGGLDLRNIRFARYQNGHYVLASLDRGEVPTALWANDREVVHQIIDMLMDEMERHQSGAVMP